MYNIYSKDKEIERLITLSTLYPGSYQIELMKYNGKPSQALIDEAFKGDGRWVAQQKYDGALYMLEKIDNEHIYLFARTKSRKTGELVEKSANVPHIIQWAKNLPDDTVLLGEIYVPGGKSNNVTSIMGCTPINAQNRQYKSEAYGGPIHYYVFDCIRFNGINFVNTGFVNRFKKFQDWFREQDEIPIWVAESVESVDGVGEVEVKVVWSPVWDLSKMSEEAKFQMEISEFDESFFMHGPFGY